MELVADKFYSFEEMRNALLDCGHFAHMTRPQIIRGLAKMYKLLESQYETDERYGDPKYIMLARAINAGKCKLIFEPWLTLENFSRINGYCCCLCGVITYRSLLGCSPHIDNFFNKSPISVLSSINTEDATYGSSLCYDCDRIAIHSCRPENVGARAVKYFTKKQHAERLRQNAHFFASLLFDPRKQTRSEVNR